MSATIKKLTQDELDKYNNALEIVKGYPNAIKIILSYSQKVADEGITLNDKTHINLSKFLSAREINVLVQYVKDNLRATKFSNPEVDYDVNNFPIDFLSKIDLDTLKNTRNCGTHSYNRIKTLIQIFE